MHGGMVVPWRDKILLLAQFAQFVQSSTPPTFSLTRGQLGSLLVLQVHIQVDGFVAQLAHQLDLHLAQKGLEAPIAWGGQATGRVDVSRSQAGRQCLGR